jgi:hypothetical protein
MVQAERYLQKTFKGSQCHNNCVVEFIHEICYISGRSCGRRRRKQWWAMIGKNANACVCQWRLVPGSRAVALAQTANPHLLRTSTLFCCI